MATMAAAACGEQENTGRRRKLRLPMALPALRGRWFKAFRVAWFIALFAALAATVAGLQSHSIMDEKWGKPYSELGLRFLSSSGTKLGLPIGEETRRAGIVNGSELIAIEGVRLPPVKNPGEVAALLRAAKGDYVNIRTRLPDGKVRDHRLRRSEDHLRQAYANTGISVEARHILELVLSLAVVAMTLGAAILLFRSAKGAPVASLLSIALLVGIAAAEPARSLYAYYGWQTLLLKVIGLSGAALVLVMFVFPNGRFQSRWGFFAFLVYALIALFPQSNPAVAAIAGVVSMGIVVFAVVSIGLRYRRLEPGMERQQIRWAFFGFASSIIVAFLWLGGLLLAGLTPDERTRIWAMVIGEIAQHLSMMLMIAGLMVALMRYRLYDAEAVISRSTGYAILTMMLGAAFAAGAKGVEWTFETSFGREAGALPGAVGAGLAMLLITPLHRRVHGWAERRFQKALLRLRRDLPDCVGDLRETASLELLLNEALKRVAAGVRTTHAAMLVGNRIEATLGVPADEAVAWAGGAALDGATQRVVCDFRDPLFPVRVPLCVQHEACEPLGWLLLGPRPDGSLYGKDERDALAEISDPLARAVRVVLLREEREIREAARYQRVERRFAELEEMLARLLKSGAAAAR